MEVSSTTQTIQVEVKPVQIKWGYCDINPITQVMEHFLNQRKKHG
jgi:hypothetical protein